MIWLTRPLVLLFALGLAIPSWAEHEEASAPRPQAVEASLTEELGKLGIQPADPISVQLSEPKKYTESDWFNGNTYFEQATLPLNSPLDVAALSLRYSRCRSPFRSFPDLAKAWQKGERQVPLTTMLPNFVGEHIGQSGHDGANCWNTTLNFHGCAKAVCYSPREEIQTIMDGDKFHALGNGDRLQPGDVVAVYEGEPGTDTLKHTAVYIGGNAFFQKASTSDNDPYTYETFEDVVRFYRNQSNDVRFRVYRKSPKPTQAH